VNDDSAIQGLLEEGTLTCYPRLLSGLKPQTFDRLIRLFN
jgi:hypothetical protein